MYSAISLGECLIMETALVIPQSSPLLRGGHALTRRVHDMFMDNKKQDHTDLVKQITSKLSTSPSKNPLYLMETRKIQSPMDLQMCVEPKLTVPAVINTRKCFTDKDSQVTEVKLLRATITKHEKRLDEMQQTVMRLEEGTVCTNRHVAHVRRKVSQHETVFQDTLNQTQRSLQHHADMLVKQQHFSQVVLRERRDNQDMVFDTGFLMLSMYIVQTPLVQYTIQIVTSRWIRGVHRHKRWIPQALQVAYIFHIYHILKYINVRMGVSSIFWNSAQWMSTKMRSVCWQFVKVLAYPGSVLSPPSPNRATNANTGSQNNAQKTSPSPIRVSGLNGVRETSLKGGVMHRPPIVMS